MARLIGTDAKEHVRDAACDNFFLSIGITEICKLKSDTHDQHVSTANDQIETANGKPFSSIRSSKALNMALAPRPWGQHDEHTLLAKVAMRRKTNPHKSLQMGRMTAIWSANLLWVAHASASIGFKYTSVTGLRIKSNIFVHSYGSYTECSPVPARYTFHCFRQASSNFLGQKQLKCYSKCIFRHLFSPLLGAAEVPRQSEVDATWCDCWKKSLRAYWNS